ncbi:MAG: LssY C-terminal domain-containing protein [Deltaproteobacteria bacterium]|nr:LssY C-terminal domain-containing protein [Deltaproteobacteria bacterium]
MTRRRIARGALLLLAAYGLLAYVLLPRAWRHHEHLPAMATLPVRTLTPDGLPGDPLNVALIGDEAQVRSAFAAAGWSAAVPVTLRSGARITESVLLDRPDRDAPVSPLLLWGRREDLAFEREVGRSARERHHVRFWRSPIHGDGARPVWVGAASFDRGVELSRRTGQVTHRIAPDLDAERDRVVGDLDAAGRLVRIFAVGGMGPTLAGRNGGGDPFFTDGEIYVGELGEGVDAAPALGRAERLPSPALVVVKDTLWSWLEPALAGGLEPALAGGLEPAPDGGPEPAPAGGPEPARAGDPEPARGGGDLDPGGGSR